MIWTPKAVIDRPSRTSLAKPSHSVGSSAIARPAIAVSCIVDICGPPCGTGDEQQGPSAHREGDQTGERERGLRADRRDRRAAERQRTQLGAVARGVVDG